MNEDPAGPVATIRTFDGGSVTASKNSLSACTEYFEALFNGPLSNPRQADFYIGGVSTEILEAIVTYCCTGHVVITIHNVQDLTVAAERLLVDGLRDECSAFISRNIDFDNAVMVLEMARFYFLDSLYKSAFRFLLDNIENVYPYNRDFTRLSLKNLVNLLGSNELKVRREEVVWEAAVDWIKANPKERMRFLGTLLRHIRFGLMESRYLRKVVLRNSFVRRNVFCKTIVQLCHDFQKYDRDSCPSGPTPHMFVHRAPAEILFIYGGVCNSPKSDTWELYDHKTNEWSTVRTNFNEQRVYGPQCAAIGHKIYVVGTQVDTQTPFCYCFDPVAMMWSPINPMSQPRALFNAVVIGSVVYCIGGSPDGCAILDTAEMYDSIADTWQAVCRMNHPRLGAGATSCAGHIYVVGGMDPREPVRSAGAYDHATCMSKEEPLRSVEVYDPAADQWSVVASMKIGRQFPGLVTYRDKIYAIGGLLEESIVVEVYNPKTGKWSASSKGKALKGKVVATVLGDRIYAIGETNHKDCKRSLEYFSGDDGKWHVLPGSFPQRWFYSACVLKNLPNTLDYIPRARDRHSSCNVS